MTDDETQVSFKLATDEHDLVACECGANDLHWRGPADHNASEASHTLDEARGIGGELSWETHDPDDFDEDVAGISFEEFVEKERSKAERNGVVASCGSCYSTMSPTVAANEMQDRLER